MAAVVLGPSFSWKALYENLQKELPPYSIPLFFRVVERIDTTGALPVEIRSPRELTRALAVAETHKYMKAKLAASGFDITLIADSVYIIDRAAKTYVPLSAARYESVASGTTA